MATDKAPVNYSDGISPGQDYFQRSTSAIPPSAEADSSWEMIGLGLDEPMPPPDVVAEL